MAAIQEKHFICDVGACVQTSNFVVHLDYGDQQTRGISLLTKRTLVYVPNDQEKSRLGPFLADSSGLVLMGDWSAVLGPKLDKEREVGRS